MILDAGLPPLQVSFKNVLNTYTKANWERTVVLGLRVSPHKALGWVVVETRFMSDCKCDCPEALRWNLDDDQAAGEAMRVEAHLQKLEAFALSLEVPHGVTVPREVTHPKRVRYSAKLLVRGIFVARGARNKQLSGHHVVGQVLPLLPTPVQVLLEEKFQPGAPDMS